MPSQKLSRLSRDPTEDEGGGGGNTSTLLNMGREGTPGKCNGGNLHPNNEEIKLKEEREDEEEFRNGGVQNELIIIKSSPGEG